MGPFDTIKPPERPPDADLDDEEQEAEDYDEEED